MTFDFGMWLLTPSTYEGSHVAPMNQLWLKSIKACGRQSQMLTCFHNNNNRQQTTARDNNNRGQSDAYVSFLLKQVTQKQKQKLIFINMIIAVKTFFRYM